MAENTNKPAPQSVFNDYYAARGQNYCWGNCPSSATRTCFANDCPCFDEPHQTQCFAQRKANFDRENPPRGELTGVCWAVQGRWERDAQSGNEVYRTRSPVYSRVRYNETQTLSKWARDDRDAGFEVEVEAAWKKFVQDNYGPDFPATGGWNWATRCVSLNRPRKTEDKDWAKAQEEATYQRVFLPTYGIADTPEERALEAKLAAERKAKEAEIARQEDIKRKEAAARAAEAERQRLAAEAARKAELARAEAERQRKVDAIAQQLGPGKREAAERLQKMNEELAALRPKPKPVSSARQAPKTNQTSRQCTRPAYTTKWSTGPVLTELKNARAEYATLATKACQGRGGTVSPIRCGKVVKVLGASFSSCEATISCAAYTDDDCGAKVSPQ
jgi:hypothetical protein